MGSWLGLGKANIQVVDRRRTAAVSEKSERVILHVYK